MKLKNVSARGYGVFGKLISPLQEFEVTSEQEVSVYDLIAAGDFVVIESVEADKEPAKRGRKPNQPTEE